MKRCLIFLLCFWVHALYAQQRNELNIYFDSDKDYIPDTSALSLVRMANAAQFDTVVIYGHCDSIGSDGYNKILSERRVKSVRQMLQMNGLKKEIIKSAVGYGEQKPIASNGDSVTRRLNRRVEIIFAKGNNMPMAKVIEKPKQKAIEKPIEKMKVITIVEEKQTRAAAKLITKKEAEQLTKETFTVGDVLEFKQLQFQPAFHYLLQGREAIVNEIAAMLKKHPNVKVEIQGHVCCTSSDEEDGVDQEYLTQNLSFTRAYYIKTLLEDKGIAGERMRAVGKRGTEKIDELERTEEAKTLNRRVEIHVIEQ
jgi:outer membrane protein OmpA-like peptidoglycan-associated protein